MKIKCYVALFILLITRVFAQSNYPADVWPLTNHLAYSLGGSNALAGTSTTNCDFSFITKDSTQTSTNLFTPTNSVWQFLVEEQSVWTCTGTNGVTTSNVVNNTDSFYTVVCYLNPTNLVPLFMGAPATTTSITVSNTRSVVITNQPRLVTTTYTAIQSTNPTSWFSKPQTNLQFNTKDIWTYDIISYINDRESIAGGTAYTYQRIQPTTHSTIASNVPLWKSWLLSNAKKYVVSPLQDTNGTFIPWCNSPNTNWVWTSRSEGKYWNGTNVVVVPATNLWVGTALATQLPMWSTQLFYVVYGGITNGKGIATLTSTKPTPTSKPASIEECLLVALDLPYDAVTNSISTNITTINGWEVQQYGKQTLIYTNTAVTNVILNSSYFQYTPSLHYATYSSNAIVFAKGEGRFATNVFNVDTYANPPAIGPAPNNPEWVITPVVDGLGNVYQWMTNSLTIIPGQDPQYCDWVYHYWETYRESYHQQIGPPWSITWFLNQRQVRLIRNDTTNFIDRLLGDDDNVPYGASAILWTQPEGWPYLSYPLAYRHVQKQPYPASVVVTNLMGNSSCPTQQITTIYHFDFPAWKTNTFGSYTASLTNYTVTSSNIVTNICSFPGIKYYVSYPKYAVTTNVVVCGDETFSYFPGNATPNNTSNQITGIDYIQNSYSTNTAIAPSKYSSDYLADGVRRGLNVLKAAPLTPTWVSGKLNDPTTPDASNIYAIVTSIGKNGDFQNPIIVVTNTYVTTITTNVVVDFCTNVYSYSTVTATNSYTNATPHTALAATINQAVSTFTLTNYLPNPGVLPSGAYNVISNTQATTIGGQYRKDLWVATVTQTTCGVGGGSAWATEFSVVEGGGYTNTFVRFQLYCYDNYPGGLSYLWSPPCVIEITNDCGTVSSLTNCPFDQYAPCDEAGGIAQALTNASTWYQAYTNFVGFGTVGVDYPNWYPSKLFTNDVSDCASLSTLLSNAANKTVCDPQNMKTGCTPTVAVNLDVVDEYNTTYQSINHITASFWHSATKQPLNYTECCVDGGIITQTSVTWSNISMDVADGTNSGYYPLAFGGNTANIGPDVTEALSTNSITTNLGVELYQSSGLGITEVPEDTSSIQVYVTGGRPTRVDTAPNINANPQLTFSYGYTNNPSIYLYSANTPCVEIYNVGDYVATNASDWSGGQLILSTVSSNSPDPLKVVLFSYPWSYHTNEIVQTFPTNVLNNGFSIIGKDIQATYSSFVNGVVTNAVWPYAVASWDTNCPIAAAFDVTNNVPKTILIPDSQIVHYKKGDTIYIPSGNIVLTKSYVVITNMAETVHKTVSGDTQVAHWFEWKADYVNVVVNGKVVGDIAQSSYPIYHLKRTNLVYHVKEKIAQPSVNFSHK